LIKPGKYTKTTQWAAIDDLYMGTWLTNFVWAKNVHLGINDPTVQQQLLDIFMPGYLKHFLTQDSQC
jgi:hypothetical protein